SSGEIRSRLTADGQQFESARNSIWATSLRPATTSTFGVVEDWFDVGRSGFEAVQQPLHFRTNNGKFGNHLLCSGVVPPRFERQKLLIKHTDSILDLTEVDGDGTVRVDHKPALVTQVVELYRHASRMRILQAKPQC